jgi:hypothetical protein
MVKLEMAAQQQPSQHSLNIHQRNTHHRGRPQAAADGCESVAGAEHLERSAAP